MLFVVSFNNELCRSSIEIALFAHVLLDSHLPVSPSLSKSVRATLHLGSGPRGCLTHCYDLRPLDRPKKWPIRPASKSQEETEGFPGNHSKRVRFSAGRMNGFRGFRYIIGLADAWISEDDAKLPNRRLHNVSV
jgi:hypothetical protein